MALLEENAITPQKAVVSEEDAIKALAELEPAAGGEKAEKISVDLSKLVEHLDAADDQHVSVSFSVSEDGHKIALDNVPEGVTVEITSDGTIYISGTVKAVKSFLSNEMVIVTNFMDGNITINAHVLLQEIVDGLPFVTDEQVFAIPVTLQKNIMVAQLELDRLITPKDGSDEMLTDSPVQVASNTSTAIEYIEDTQAAFSIETSEITTALATILVSPGLEVTPIDTTSLGIAELASLSPSNGTVVGSSGDGSVGIFDGSPIADNGVGTTGNSSGIISSPIGNGDDGDVGIGRDITIAGGGRGGNSTGDVAGSNDLETLANITPPEDGGPSAAGSGTGADTGSSGGGVGNDTIDGGDGSDGVTDNFDVGGNPSDSSNALDNQDTSISGDQDSAALGGSGEDTVSSGGNNSGGDGGGSLGEGDTSSGGSGGGDSGGSAPSNSAPEFSQDNIVLEWSGSGGINKVFSATDPDGDTLTYTLQGPSNAFDAIDFDVLSTGVHIYGSNYSDEIGVFNYVITATDSSGASDTLNLTFDISEPNQAPTFAALTAPDQFNFLVELGDTVTFGFSASDADGDTLTAGMVGAPSFTILNLSFDGGTGTGTFSTVADILGAHSFSITVDDGNGGTAQLNSIIKVVDDLADSL